jgi:hypothetical protein
VTAAGDESEGDMAGDDPTNADLIVSKSDLFRGDLVERPKKALVVGKDEEEFPIYACPKCGNQATAEQCDVLGAEPDCVFCQKCHTEFEL